MSRKDYRVIARALADARPIPGMFDGCDGNTHDAYRRAESVWRHLVEELACALASDNPRFRFDKFREACGA